MYGSMRICGDAQRVLGRERMLARARALRCPMLRPRIRFGRSGGPAAAAASFGQREVVEPRDAEVRSDEQLQLPVGDVRGAAVLRVPRRRAAFGRRPGPTSA